MSFRKPQFGPQNIGDLLEAIFACNGIEGPDRCGSREERTDTPKVGAPFKVCTVTFPADVVGYAEQRDFRIDGPDGSVYLYGKAVNRRKVKLEKARRAARAREAKAKAKADAEGRGSRPARRQRLPSQLDDGTGCHRGGLRGGQDGDHPFGPRAAQ
jgi:hypothetical protein